MTIQRNVRHHHKSDNRLDCDRRRDRIAYGLRWRFHLQADDLRYSLAIALVGMLLPQPVEATEGGATNKALGVDTVLVGVMGPPGSVRLTTFLGYYRANETLDGSGNPRPGISNFDLNVSAFTFRFQYVWPDAKLWGANIETRIGTTLYANVDVDFDVQTPGGPVHRSSGASGTFPGMLFAPAILGWHSETVHQMAGPELFLSSRNYRKGQIAQVATGFNSVAPAYWITWYPNDRIEVDGSFVYLFNGKNNETRYRSGQEFNLDYAAGYAVTPTWQAGANGYVYQQTTNDTVNGNAVPGGNKGRAFAIGPFVRYHVDPNWGITLKWQIESLVENRAKGNRFFLQFALRLW